MKGSEIEKTEELLNRYYNGESSEAEEKALRQALAEADGLPPHLQVEKEYFRQLAACAEVPEMPEGMEQRLSRLVDRRVRIFRLRWIGGVAAGLLLLLSVGGYLYRPTPAPTPQDTCATPTEAYAQAQKALLKLSITLNKGVEGVEDVHAMAAKAQKDVIDQLNRINNTRQ
ncbi:MAG: hypothetical protein LBN24_09740 [Mediterranea sp.]|jgi:hypothetical protein|nr:hypothetical protein [Mediterranea sp.]